MFYIQNVTYFYTKRSFQLSLKIQNHLWEETQVEKEINYFSVQYNQLKRNL